MYMHLFLKLCWFLSRTQSGNVHCSLECAVALLHAFQLWFQSRSIGLLFPTVNSGFMFYVALVPSGPKSGMHLCFIFFQSCGFPDHSAGK